MCAEKRLSYKIFLTRTFVSFAFLAFNTRAIWCCTLGSVVLGAYIFSSLDLVVHGATDGNFEVKSEIIQDFNFVAAGDFGCNQNSNETIIGMISKRPELVIPLGDLSYVKKDASCWLKAISPLDKEKKVKITLGEHDVTDNINKYFQYVNHFNLTSPYYSFDFQNVHFLVMATAKERKISYSNDSEQYEFVKRDLNNAHKNSSINWIIVTTFRAFYSSNTTHPGLDELQETYHQLFDEYGVDLVLQAHNHNYQRTYPLSYNQTKQSTPVIRDSNTQDYEKIFS